MPNWRNAKSWIGVIFLITGLLGFGLGSVLSLYLALPNGPVLRGIDVGNVDLVKRLVEQR